MLILLQSQAYPYWKKRTQTWFINEGTSMSYFRKHIDNKICCQGHHWEIRSTTVYPPATIVYNAYMCKRSHTFSPRNLAKFHLLWYGIRFRLDVQDLIIKIDLSAVKDLWVWFLDHNSSSSIFFLRDGLDV